VLGVVALGVGALGVAALREAAVGALEFIIYLELWGGGVHLGVIFTNSCAVRNKLCLLYVRLQAFKSLIIREQAEGKKELKHSLKQYDNKQCERDAYNKNNQVTPVSSGYKTCSCHKVSKCAQSAYTECKCVCKTSLLYTK
jgi:hypothetical protein